MIALRKNLTIEKGETRLFNEIRYFFYITNDREIATQDVRDVRLDYSAMTFKTIFS